MDFYFTFYVNESKNIMSFSHVTSNKLNKGELYHSNKLNKGKLYHSNKLNKEELCHSNKLN